MGSEMCIRDRAFTERMDEMVEARAAEMTVDEAEALIEEGVVEEAPSEEEVAEEPAEEVVEEPAEEESSGDSEEVAEEAEAPAEAEATWNSDVDPWADN